MSGPRSTLVQNDCRNRETDEAEDSYETEDTVDEDGDASISLRVVAEFGDKSLGGFLD